MMPLLDFLVFDCVLVGCKPMVEKTLEEEYKGCRTRAKQMIQEQQGEVECYV
jgi:hypothetical protein